jgi:hypothetical protein
VFHGDTAIVRVWHFAIGAIKTVYVRAEHVVGEVPARHILFHILLVHDLAIFVEVLPALTGHSQLALTAIIFVE